MDNNIHAANYRLIIAGGRDFNNYELLTKTLIEWAKVPNLSIISGTARGADSLGERWATEHNKLIWKFPADWNTYGKSAGYRRNDEMAKHATHLCAFWDGKSLGTRHMISLARAHGLTVHVQPY